MSTEEFDRSFAYRIVRESILSKNRKLEIVQAILGKKKGKRFYYLQKLQAMKEKLTTTGHRLSKYQG